MRALGLMTPTVRRTAIAATSALVLVAAAFFAAYVTKWPARVVFMPGRIVQDAVVHAEIGQGAFHLVGIAGAFAFWMAIVWLVLPRIRI